MESSSGLAACPECGAGNGIEIELRLPDGTEVRFCSCHRCEAKWWRAEGEELALGDVLELARRHQP